MLKSLHVTLAYLTAVGFVLRGLWSITDSPLRRERWVRVAPHLVDTLLLALGVTLAFRIGASLADPWLAAKMSALLGYIGFGVLAMRGPTRSWKTAGFVAALGFLAYLFAVAYTRSPWPLAAA
ncbi:MAG: SirB2 family protein [Pseudomonadales bacterium]